MAAGGEPLEVLTECGEMAASRSQSRSVQAGNFALAVVAWPQTLGTITF